MTIKLKFRIQLLVTLTAIGCSIAITWAGFAYIKSSQATSHQMEKDVRGLTEIKASALSTIQLDPTTDDTKRIFDDAEQNIGKWAEVVRATSGISTGSEQFKDAISKWSNYDRKSHQLIDLAKLDVKTANDQVSALYRSDFVPFQAQLERIIVDAGRRAAQEDAEASKAADSVLQIITITMSAGLLIVAGWTFSLSRSIQRTLWNMQFNIEDITRTLDVRKRVSVHTMDEIGRTATAFNSLIERVAQTMHSLQYSAESVSIASKQIAAGNTDLSSRTEAQAASLQETAANMEQLTGTVRQNADGARHARGLATDASETARKGNQVVSEVVNTMSQIDESSSKIAEIIGIIEGIAFQTNILALNAAVEAARAGEQGRGFAVVAGEVRSLAQRSSVAAKEIKVLIDTSAARVNLGMHLADQAGSTMQAVIAAVSRVNDIMEEIAAASDEQSRGIDQVAQAITQMDDVTQRNAALVGQSAVAAQALDDQAAKLNAVVAEFKLSSNHRLPAMPSHQT